MTSNTIFISRLIDTSALERATKSGDQSVFFVDADVVLGNKHIGCELKLPTLMIQAVRRSKTPLKINIFTNKIVKRISDKKGGTWQRLVLDAAEDNQIIAKWVPSDWHDDYYLYGVERGLYVDLFF